MEKSVIWRGYEHKPTGNVRMQPVHYSIELTAKKAEKLWKRLKQWKGSQEDFYFKYVNPRGLCELPNEPKSRKKGPIKTALKGGKRI